MQSFRIILFQNHLGIPVNKKEINEIRAFKPHFVCFPEYFFVNQHLNTMNQTPHNQALQLKRMRTLSRELNTVIIGGTMPELEDGRVYNSSFVFDRGKLLGSYRKKHLFFPEVGKITPGTSFKTFTAYGITFGVLICADVFHDESFEFMRKEGASLVFIPTFSPRKEETAEVKFKRDREIYVRGAGLADAVLVKVCGVPSPFKTFLQARSLIADNEKILFRVNPEEEEKAIIIRHEIMLSPDTKNSSPEGKTDDKKN